MSRNTGWRSAKWSPPFLYTNRRAFPAPSFSVSLEEGGRAVLRAAFSWAPGLPGALGTRSLLADFCICSPWEWRIKEQAVPLLWATKKSLFSRNEGDPYSHFPLEAPITLFLNENSHAPQDLGWTHSPVILKYNRVSPNNKKPWWQMHSWAVMPL